MSTIDPIIMAREIECSDWLSLDNLPFGAWGRVNFTGIMWKPLSEAMGQGNGSWKSNYKYLLQRPRRFLGFGQDEQTVGKCFILCGQDAWIYCGNKLTSQNLSNLKLISCSRVHGRLHGLCSYSHSET